MATAQESGSLSDRVASHVKDAILDGSLDLGESLSEDTLAEVLGVSRTPVRQALQLLQTQGLVQIVPRSGSYVFVPTEEQIAELCDFRLAMEQQAVSWAFRRHRAESAEALATVVDTMTQAIAERDMQQYGRADTAFHQVFFDNCDNSYLRKSYTMNLVQVAALRTHLATYTEAEPMRSFADHEAIRDVFADGREADIGDILTAHILRTKENYTATLRRRQERKSETRLQHLHRVLKPRQAATDGHPQPDAFAVEA
ncbi:DNA-binding GntR family transcriptional regulator [Homoserinimonas aerilata]|uniref:DNA-binding GntR family transcriptional regulator n=1 Tax=Homoserinimonas aerilata TaxID=1162970 RepID=A0A542YFA3_9MICO|nr:GntR family transcriptional regulator [Homoserinimonas aerilata]TQL46761.1 DNA-binding GntR family transcriptional regulator [Homoserinimonas aerilata]